MTPPPLKKKHKNAGAIMQTNIISKLQKSTILMCQGLGKDSFTWNDLHDSYSILKSNELYDLVEYFIKTQRKTFVNPFMTEAVII